MKKLIGLSIMALTIASCGTKAPQLRPDNIDEVIAAMTPEEKVKLVIGTGMKGFSGDSAVVGATKGKVPGAAGTTYPIPRLGIPSVVLADGPAGLRIDPTRPNDSETYYCTHFPIGTLLACTWDTTLVAKVGKAIGEEVLEYGADVLLAPALNTHRNPLCGRNFEYYSEDPVVSGNIAAAYVQGVQSNDVGTSVKHFAVNSQETNRMANDARVSERALRELYLKGFEIAVKESDPWTVMSSYNYVNGDYTSESPELLTTVLRDEWGYDGMVMTDWFGGSDAVKQMIAGNDMLQPGKDKQYEQIMKGLEDGTLDEKVLDRNVKRILEMIVKTPSYKGYKYSNKPDLKAHAEITRQSATEGMVLLKNNANTLPLAKDIKNVAVYGNGSYDFIAGGTGSGNVNRAYTVSHLDGLDNAGYKTDKKLEDAYRAYLKNYYENLPKSDDPFSAFLPAPLPDEMVIDPKDIARQAEELDMALITIGRQSGEFVDRTSSDFSLSLANKKLIEDVTKAFHAKGKKVVVIMNVGGVIETASWKDKPDAILCAWQGGQEGGNSVADVLTGKAYPSGKLTMTFPKNFRDHASSANFPIDTKANMDITNNQARADSAKVKNVDYTNYDEDIYVGYRYFDTFGKDVSYPFGYGLSYTEFEYGQPTVEKVGDKYVVKVDVKNVGAMPGKEVVQLYVTAPDAKTANKPEKELKAFAKTGELAPGATESVVLQFNAEDLASFDADNSKWVVTPGEYAFLVGASSRDIRKSVGVQAEGSERSVNKVLSPKEPLNLLKRK
ncbi:MAG: glycoside hydrolase family 3 C-terminal domain-containing protein [Muribaculaceae bacterium]|nr:glycoside hydrolase family 3 C-terminal domain-containing protein [Muribaculaceae bacterium]